MEEREAKEIGLREERKDERENKRESKKLPISEFELVQR